jgi:hypothetical protein
MARMGGDWEELNHGDSSSEALVTLDEGTHLPQERRSTFSYISKPDCTETFHSAFLDWKDTDTSGPHKDLNIKERRDCANKLYKFTTYENGIAPAALPEHKLVYSCPDG